MKNWIYNLQLSENKTDTKIMTIPIDEISQIIKPAKHLFFFIHWHKGDCSVINLFYVTLRNVVCFIYFNYWIQTKQLFSVVSLICQDWEFHHWFIESFIIAHVYYDLQICVGRPSFIASSVLCFCEPSINQILANQNVYAKKWVFEISRNFTLV